MKTEFDDLYSMIVSSNNIKHMHILGDITKSMMYKFIEAYPQTARGYLDTLQAIKWNNYVTKKEAEQIVSNMEPKPMWSYSRWEELVKENHNVIAEHEPCYNKYALYVVMCMIASDSINTIKELFEQFDQEADEKKLFKFIYKLAIDKLQDVDKKFNLRSYFEL